MLWHTIAALAAMGLVVAASGYNVHQGIGHCNKGYASQFSVRSTEPVIYSLLVTTPDECWVACESLTGEYTYPYAHFEPKEPELPSCHCITECQCLDETSNSEIQALFPIGEAPPPYNCSVWETGWQAGIMSKGIQNCTKLPDPSSSIEEHCSVDWIKKPVDQWSLWLLDPLDFKSRRLGRSPIDRSNILGCVANCANSHADVFERWKKAHSGLYQTSIIGDPVSSHLPEVRQFCQDCVREGGVGDSCFIIPFCMLHVDTCTEKWGPSSHAPLHHLIELCHEVAQVELEGALTKFKWAGYFAREFGVRSQMNLALTASGWNLDMDIEDMDNLSSLSKAVAHGGIVAVNLTGDVKVLGGPLIVPTNSILVIVGNAPADSSEGFQLITKSIKQGWTVEAAVQRHPVLDAVSTGRIFVVGENATLIVAGLTLRGAVGSAVCAHQNSKIQVWRSALEDNHASFGIDTSMPGCPAEVGGAIYCGGCSSLMLMDSHFNRNSAGAGGAVFATGYGRSHIQNCTFSGNWASAGGGLYIQDSGSKSSAEQCLVWDTGVCVKKENSDDGATESTTMVSCRLLDGHLKEPSGMQAYLVRNQHAPVEGIVDGIQLTGGQACLGCLPTFLPHGGCLAAVGIGSMIIEDTEFRGCKALPPDSSVVPEPSFPFRMGGGLFLQDTTATLYRSVVAENVASIGGGLFLQRANANLKHSTIAENMAATGGGGGLFATEGQMSLLDMVITQNQANDAGGGLALQGMVTVMEETNITDNLAPHGGGGLVRSGRAELERVVFARNMRPNSLKSTDKDMKKFFLNGILELFFIGNWSGLGGDLGDADVRADRGASVIANGVQFDQTAETMRQEAFNWLDSDRDGTFTGEDFEMAFRDVGILIPKGAFGGFVCSFKGCFHEVVGASSNYMEECGTSSCGANSKNDHKVRFHFQWGLLTNLGNGFRVGLMNGATWTSRSLCPEGTAEPFPQAVVPFHVDLGDASKTKAWRSPVLSHVLNIAECLQCPAGTYNSRLGAAAKNPEGAGACKQCSAGRASVISRATSNTVCTACQAGQYAPAGSSECLRCPYGTSKGSIGQRSCPCARGFVLQPCVGACSTGASSLQGLVCPDGWIAWQASCYLKLNRKAQNYDDAVSMCKGLQGHLPIITSPDENQKVLEMNGGALVLALREVTGNKEPLEQVWEWPDGTCSATRANEEQGLNCTGYSNWQEGQPDDHDEPYVELLEDGTWESMDWDEDNLDVLCERPPGRCLQCSDPLATTATEGSSSLNDCVCREETFLRPGLGCSRCHEGLKCPGMSDAAPMQMEGFMVDVIDAHTREYSVYRCLNPARCPQGPIGNCNGGASGLMCLDCPMEPTRHYWNDRLSQCVDCSESGSTTWVMPVAILMLGVGMAAVFRSSLPKDGREQLSAALEVAVSLGLFLVMAQTASIFGRLIIPWGSPLDKILEFCRFFALDLGILQLNCVVGFGYVERFILGSMLPVIGVVVYGLVAALLLKLGRVCDAQLRAVNSIGLITQALFIGFLLHGIEPFLVFSHPNGKKSMMKGPEILVGSPLHSQLLVLGLIHLAIYGIGFLSFCLFACRRIWLRARSGEARGVKAIMWYRFLYFKFVPHRYYWGLVHLVRATLIALTPVIFESPHLQIVLLTTVLTTFLCLQCIFWPYRANMHNILDIAVHAAMISLCSAASFFLPTEGALHASIVNMVLTALGLCGFVFACVLLIPIASAIHARCFQTEEERDRQRRKILAIERKFAAELQQTQEDELFGAEELRVDIEQIISIKPQLEARRLVQVLSGTDPRGVEDIEILLPRAHSLAEAAANGLAVYEKKLRWRAQEFFDKSGGSLEKKRELEMRHYTPGFKSPVAWTMQEAREVEQLMDFVQWFMSSYSATLLCDEKSLHALKIYMVGMQAKFQGVYQACVRDLLQKEPGFHAAVGLGTFLQKQVVAEAGRPAPVVTEDNITMYVRAVITQELLVSYVTELSGATRGRMAKTNATKHLWRVIEKQCVLPTKEQASVWDVARTLVEYDSMQRLAHGLEHLQKDHSQGKIQILRVKERFSEPTSGGWSDVLVNICFPSKDPQVQPLPCEIQFVHSQLMLIRQEMGAHTDYSKFRVAHEIIELHEADYSKFRDAHETAPNEKQDVPVLEKAAAEQEMQVQMDDECSTRFPSKEKWSGGDWGQPSRPSDSHSPQPPPPNELCPVLPGAM